MIKHISCLNLKVCSLRAAYFLCALLTLFPLLGWVVEHTVLYDDVISWVPQWLAHLFHLFGVFDIWQSPILLGAACMLLVIVSFLLALEVGIVRDKWQNPSPFLDLSELKKRAPYIHKYSPKSLVLLETYLKKRWSHLLFSYEDTQFSYALWGRKRVSFLKRLIALLAIYIFALSVVVIYATSSEWRAYGEVGRNVVGYQISAEGMVATPLPISLQYAGAIIEDYNADGPTQYKVRTVAMLNDNGQSLPQGKEMSKGGYFNIGDYHVRLAGLANPQATAALVVRDMRDARKGLEHLNVREGQTLHNGPAFSLHVKRFNIGGVEEGDKLDYVLLIDGKGQEYRTERLARSRIWLAEDETEWDFTIPINTGEVWPQVLSFLKTNRHKIPFESVDEGRAAFLAANTDFFETKNPEYKQQAAADGLKAAYAVANFKAPYVFYLEDVTWDYRIVYHIIKRPFIWLYWAALLLMLISHVAFRFLKFEPLYIAYNKKALYLAALGPKKNLKLKDIVAGFDDPHKS